MTLFFLLKQSRNNAVCVAVQRIPWSSQREPWTSRAAGWGNTPTPAPGDLRTLVGGKSRVSDIYHWI